VRLGLRKRSARYRQTDVFIVLRAAWRKIWQASCKRDQLWS